MISQVLDIIVREDGSRVVARNISLIGTSALAADKAIVGLRRTLGLVGAGAVINQIRQLSDAYTTIQNRLRLTTTDQGNLNAVFDELYAISQRTRSSLESNANLYSRIALAARDLGTSQKDILEFTESLNQAIKISGATAQEASAGLIQLSQGLASGRLNGDELRSVLEQLPGVADVIAKGMGVFRGDLRKLGAQGKITAQVILDAFKASREEIAEKFAKTIPTVAEGFLMVKNAAIVMIGEINEAGGVTTTLGKGLRDLTVFMMNLTPQLVSFTRALVGSLDPADELSEEVKVFATIFVTLWGILKGVVTFIYNTLIAAFQAVGKVIGSIAAAIGAFGQMIMDVFKGLGQIFSGFGQAIELASKGEFTAAGEALSTAFTDPFADALSSGGEAATILKEGMTDAFGIALDNTKDTYDQLVGQTTDTVEKLVQIWDKGARQIQDRSSLRRGTISDESGQSRVQAPIDEKDIRALEKLQNQLESLLGQIAPLEAATIKYQEAQELLSKAWVRGLISSQDLIRYTALLTEHYRDILDPLGTYLRKLDEETYLMHLNVREREIEARLLDATKDLKKDGVTLTEAETQALRDKLGLMYDINQEMMIQDGLLAQSVESRKAFITEMQSIRDLLDNPNSGFTKADAGRALTDMMPDMFEGTQEQIDAQLDSFQYMYDQIAIMRDQDLISEQSARQMKMKVAAQEFEFRTHNASIMFDALATLTQSGNKRLAAIGRAAAVTQATIDGILAVQKALAAAPPPLNYALAAAVGVAQAENVHRIATQGFATGGSFTVGGSGGVDSQMVAFRASPDERVEISRPRNSRKGDSESGSRGRGFRDFNPTFVLPAGISKPQAGQTHAQMSAIAYQAMRRAAARNS